MTSFVGYQKAIQDDGCEPRGEEGYPLVVASQSVILHKTENGLITFPCLRVLERTQTSLWIPTSRKKRFSTDFEDELQD